MTYNTMREGEGKRYKERSFAVKHCDLYLFNHLFVYGLPRKGHHLQKIQNLLSLNNKKPLNFKLKVFFFFSKLTMEKNVLCIDYYQKKNVNGFNMLSFKIKFIDHSTLFCRVKKKQEITHFKKPLSKHAFE